MYDKFMGMPCFYKNNVLDSHPRTEAKKLTIMVLLMLVFSLRAMAQAFGQ